MSGPQPVVGYNYDDVVDALRQGGQPMTLAEVASAIDRSKETARYKLAAAEREGAAKHTTRFYGSVYRWYVPE